MHDDVFATAPLDAAVERQPDKWIPIVTRLLGSPSRAVHDAAVACLVQFHLDKARADALRPLLPWLANPRWSSARDRLRLIQSVDRLDMKDSVPGLIAVVGQVPSRQHDTSERSYAAESLAHFRDPRAVPALRQAISKEKEWDHLRRLYRGLVASGGVSADETVSALEALARQTRTPGGRDAIEQLDFFGDKTSLGPGVGLGVYLSQGPVPDEPIVRRLVERARALDRADADTAAALRAIFDGWKSKPADQDFARRLDEGQLSARSVWAALAKRASLRGSAEADLRRIASRGDGAAAVAAVLLGDARLMAGLLGGNNADAQAMLLVCARLAGDKLPLDCVSALLASKQGRAAEAAAGYLRADDSPQARRALLAGGGKAQILGNRTPHDPGHVTFSEFDETEQHLRRLVLAPGGPDEILALLSAGYWGGIGQVIVGVKAGKARLQFFPDDARSLERDLSAAELGALRAFLSEKKVEGLGPLETNVADGIQFEFVRVAPAGGRRVFMNNPSHARDPVYQKLCETFLALLARPGLALSYELGKQLPGLEVLVADPQWAVAGVRLDRGQPIIEIAHESSGWENDMSFPTAARLARPPSPPRDDDDETLLWVAWPAATPVPAEGLRRLELSAPQLPKDLHIDSWLNRQSWANRRGGVRYVVGDRQKKQGLWRISSGRPPALVAPGSLASPVLSQDGRFVIAARTEGSWAVPNHVVRIDTSTGDVARLDIPVADNLDPLLATPGGVLVVRSRDNADGFPSGTKLTGPERPEYFLVDPASKRARKIEGDFRPSRTIRATRFSPPAPTRSGR